MITERIRPPQTNDQKELKEFFNAVCKLLNSQFTGSWEYPLKLGTYFIWVDSTGDLRIDSGTPTGDTDGTIIGTQS